MPSTKNSSMVACIVKKYTKTGRQAGERMGEFGEGKGKISTIVFFTFYF